MIPSSPQANQGIVCGQIPWQGCVPVIIDLERDGGAIIGSHSVSPEIPLESYVVYHELCRTYGAFVENGNEQKEKEQEETKE